MGVRFVRVGEITRLTRIPLVFTTDDASEGFLRILQFDPILGTSRAGYGGFPRGKVQLQYIGVIRIGLARVEKPQAAGAGLVPKVHTGLDDVPKIPAAL